MDIMQSIREKAKQNIKTVVLPEGEDERTLRAAEKITSEGLAKLILLGDPETMERKSEMLGLDLSDVKLMNPRTSKFKPDFAQEFFRLRSHKGITMEQAQEIVQHPLYFGALLVRWDVAQGSVAGDRKSVV